MAVKRGGIVVTAGFALLSAASASSACTGGQVVVSDGGQGETSASGSGSGVGASSGAGASSGSGAGSGSGASSGSGSGSGASSGSGSGASSGGPFDASFLGTGAPCTPSSHQVVGTKLTLPVNWPQTLNDQGCTGASCSASVVMWLLSVYDISGSTVTGSVLTCGYQTPPVPLTALGSQAEGLPAGQTATEQIAFAPTVWNSIASNSSKAPATTTGTLGGWNVGSSLQIEPFLLTYGLRSSSSFASAATTWPCSETSLTSSDISDDDGDGNPGITATPASGSGLSLPATAIVVSAPFAPQADRLFLALRTELEMYGTSTSCTDLAGTARASLLNSHVIGCHVAQGAGCTMSQWDFIDSNTTIYLGQGVTIPASQQACAPGFAPQQIVGTFRAKILSATSDASAGAPVTCNDVLAALP
jgi:hypothetical protein